MADGANEHPADAAGGEASALPRETLVWTTEAQDAVFYVRPGFAGGIGSTPVVDYHGNVRNWNDREVFLDEGAAAAVRDVLIRVRPGVDTAEVIVVVARIQLELRRAWERHGPLLGRKYYAVRFDRLEDVAVYGPDGVRGAR